MRFADIAVNLSDPQFTGSYHGRQKHPDDLAEVVKRAKGKGVDRILITGTSLEETRSALELAKRFDLQCTAGVHPTSTSEIAKHPAGEQAYLDELEALIRADRGEGGSKRIIALGEVGLDYDRLHFAPRETQLQYLPTLLRLSQKYELPLFLHSRTPESHADLVKTLRDVGWGLRGEGWRGGVVHSFTGTSEEVDELVGMGLYIGINGCSLKTAENLKVVKHIPLDRLLLETDSPWCSISTSHASHALLPPPHSPLLLSKVNKAEKWKAGEGVKGRMEPCDVGVIAHVVASVRGMPLEELADAIWENTMRLFYPSEATIDA